MALHTHYDNLRVPRDASPEAILDAFDRLSRQYVDAKDAASVQMLSTLAESYRVLSDPEDRSQHDAWIRAHEAAQYAPSATTHGVMLPPPGASAYVQLPATMQALLRDRVNGQRQDQKHIVLDDESGHRIIVVACVLWFVYLFVDAAWDRWSSLAAILFPLVTVAAGLLLVWRLRMIRTYRRAPLRPRLMVTPLYIMHTSLDHVWYYPLSSISQYKPTHHFTNNRYQRTTISLQLGNKPHYFEAHSQKQYIAFEEGLRQFQGLLHQAAQRSDQAYIEAHDEFRDAPQSTAATTKEPLRKRVMIALVGACIGFFLGQIALVINRSQPTDGVAATQGTQWPAARFALVQPARE